MVQSQSPCILVIQMNSAQETECTGSVLFQGHSQDFFYRGEGNFGHKGRSPRPASGRERGWGFFTYKLGVIVFGCQYGRASQYLIDYCLPVSDVASWQHLRSASRRLLVVPHYHLNAYGRRAFAVAGPTVWNSLWTWTISGIQIMTTSSAC